MNQMLLVQQSGINTIDNKLNWVNGVAWEVNQLPFKQPLRLLVNELKRL